jgi:hypothetical protein
VSALAYRTRGVDERKLVRSSLGLQRARPARHYHETFGLTSYSGRGVLRCAKYRRARPARAPRSFRPVRDACAGAHRARSAQRRACWRLQHLEKYDIRRTAPVGVCRDAGRRDRGPTRIGRSMRLTVRQVFGLKGYRTNGAIRLRPRRRGSIAGPAAAQHRDLPTPVINDSRVLQLTTGLGDATVKAEHVGYPNPSGRKPRPQLVKSGLGDRSL